MSTIKTPLYDSPQTALDSNALTPQEVHTFRDNWANYDLANIDQVFLPPGAAEGKVIGFHLFNTVLENLFPAGDPVAGAEIRFYMGVDLAPSATQPPFCPIAQLILPGEDPLAYNRCYRIPWTIDITVPNSATNSTLNILAASKKPTGIIHRKDKKQVILIPVPTIDFWKFLAEWVISSDSSSLFFSDHYQKRVEFYTFNAIDTGNMWLVFNSRTTNDATDGLMMYCGVDKNTNLDFPFAFRTVLWMNQQTTVNVARFFEFSQPCPPICGSGDGN